MSNLELIAHATPTVLDEILAALPDAASEAFWREILELELDRRLGLLDSVFFISRRSVRLDHEWRMKLARVAAAGLAGLSGYDEDSLRLRLRMAFAVELPGAADPEDVALALADGRAWLVAGALDCLAAGNPSEVELLASTRPSLAADDSKRRSLGVRAVLSASSGRAHSFAEGTVESFAFALLVDVLQERSPDSLVAALALGERRRRRDAALFACRELGLLEALLERVGDQFERRHRGFVRTVSALAELLPMGHPVFGEVARALAEGECSRSHRFRLLCVLGQSRDPCFVPLFTSLLDDPRVELAAWAALLRLDSALPSALRQQMNACLDAAPAITALAWLSDTERRMWLDDERWLALQLDDSLTLDTLADLPAVHASSLESQRARLILEAERELERDDRFGVRVMVALGRLRVAPGDRAEELLLACFEDPHELARVRVASARALSQPDAIPLRDPIRQRLRAQTADPSPMIRAWAQRLVDDPRE